MAMFLLLIAPCGLSACANLSYAFGHANNKASALGQLHGPHATEAGDALAVTIRVCNLGSHLGGSSLLQVSQEGAHFRGRRDIVACVGEEHLGEFEPVVRQGACGRCSGAGRQEGRRQDDVVVGGVESSRVSSAVGSYWRRRRRRPVLDVDSRLVVYNFAEGVGMEPCRGDNVGAALLLEEECEP